MSTSGKGRTTTLTSPKEANKKRPLGTPKFGGAANKVAVLGDSCTTLSAVISYLASSGIIKDCTLFPFSCCDYDIYLIRRLKLQTPVDITRGVSAPSEYLAVLAQAGRSQEEHVRALFEIFLDSYTGQPKAFSQMSAPNLLILLAFVSFSSKRVDVLVDRGLLHSLVGSLLSMLTEKKDSTMLATAIACLAFVVERHSSLNSILTESNISQLIKLCITRALYPTSEMDEASSAMKSQFEVGASRLGLDRLLDIPLVVNSVSAASEIASFIRKWWQRLYVSSVTPGCPGSFDNPESCKQGKIPTLRTVLEIMSSLVAKLQSARRVLEEILSAADSVGLEFLTFYVTSRDHQTGLASTKLVTSIALYMTSQHNRISGYLKSDDLYSGVLLRLRCLSDPQSSRGASMPVDKQVYSPAAVAANPSKRIVSSGARKPFSDLSNRQLFEEQPTSNVDKTGVPSPFSYRAMSKPASACEEVGEGILVEAVIGAATRLLHLICSHRGDSGTANRELRDTVTGSLCSLLSFSRIDSDVLLSALDDFDDSSNPLKVILESLVAGFSCLGQQSLSDVDSDADDILVSLCRDNAGVLCTLLDSHVCPLSEDDKRLLLKHFSRSYAGSVAHDYTACSPLRKTDECEDVSEASSIQSVEIDAGAVPSVFSHVEGKCFEASENDISLTRDEVLPDEVTSACDAETSPSVIALNAKLAASMRETEQLRLELSGLKCRDEASALTLALSEKKIGMQDQVMKEMYEKLQILAKSECHLKNECDLLLTRTARLEAELGSSFSLGSALQINLAEHEALSKHFRLQAEKQAVESVDIKAKLSEGVSRYNHMVKVHEECSKQLKTTEDHLLDKTNELLKMESSFSQTIVSLEDRVAEVQSQLNAESQQLETSRAENRNLASTVQELQVQVERYRSELETRAAHAAEKDNELCEVYDKLAMQTKTMDETTAELSKQKELLHYISKISLQNAAANCTADSGRSVVGAADTSN